MKMRLAAMVLTLAAWSSDAGAGFDYTQVVESMIESQTDNGLTLLAAVGQDFATTLQFTGNVDFTTGNFSYALLGGQTYLGQSISMSTLASYDSTTGLYSWTTSGQYGTQAISGMGSVSWADDPAGDSTGTDMTTTTVTSTPLPITITSDLTYKNGTFNTTSTGTYYVGGGGASTSYSGTDTIGNDAYRATINVQLPKTPPGQLVINGDLPGNGTSTGTFTFNESFPSSPEPSSLTLCGIAGVVGLAVSRVRRRRLA